MNKLLKRGLSAWLIFIKNRLAGAIMMFVSGVMMAIAGFSGNGNDTKTLPAIIALAGAILGFWSIYRLGYIKSNIDKAKTEENRAIERSFLYPQIFETIVYLIIIALGVYLFINKNFTNALLDLICGGFTIFNGIMSLLWLYKNREDKNFSWKFRIVLAVLEFTLGSYFIIASNTITSNGYLIMGSTTTIAGIIEIIHALKDNALNDAIKDSKNIIQTFKKSKTEEISFPEN
ncbi:MAG: DUF308 domain-containing protein [Candidatus Saccharibacteria bacterium]|nr:DUF308 domain-containing protein [Candidatus Saccharibacteria bacterium]